MAVNYHSSAAEAEAVVAGIAGAGGEAVAVAATSATKGRWPPSSPSIEAALWPGGDPGEQRRDHR